MNNTKPIISKEIKTIQHLVDNLPAVTQSIHAYNQKAGWWDSGQDCMSLKFQLVSTELAEATEGERRSLMDDKLPHRPMGEVELADAITRLLDIFGRNMWIFVNSPMTGGSPLYNQCSAFFHGLQLDDESQDEFSLSDPFSVISLHWALNKLVVEISYSICTDPVKAVSCLAQFLKVCDVIQQFAGYDIVGAIHEKMEFNQTRADHQPGNRAAENGKKC